MAHYAFLDENNVVTQVIPGKDEDEGGIDWEQYYGNYQGQRCLRTSYHTHAGVHRNGGVPFRKNYAGIGWTYDDVRDAFIPPKLYSSWVFNEETCCYDPPVPYPGDETKMYEWNEDALNWIPINP
mgnify:CR=1 FL=1